MEIQKKDSTQEISTLKPLTSGLMVNDPNKFIQHIESLRVEDVFLNGTNVRSLRNNSPSVARKLLTRGLTDLIEFVDANKTISTTEQLIFSVEALMKDFPALTIEEFFIVFRDIKKGVYGKWFERFKLSEIEDCLRKYEAETRADFIEKKSREYKEAEKLLSEVDYEVFKKEHTAKGDLIKQKSDQEENYRKIKLEYLNKRQSGK